MDRYSANQSGLGTVQKGWDVYGSDDQKVGSIAEVQTGYVVAHKGFFFPKDLYIPMSAIQRVVDDRVYLNVTKDDVDAQGWDTYSEEQSAGAAGSGAATAATTRAAIPDAIGTPGLVGATDEGGRQIRASGTGAGAGAGAGTGGWGAAQVAPATAGMTAAQPTQGERLYLHEEDLRVNKQRQQAGEVRVSKEVVEEQRTINVPVTREEVVVEYLPGDRQPDQHGIDESANQTLRVPVTEETVNVEKVPVMTQEVRVGKREVQEERQVSDTVRRERARVEDQGNVRVERSGTDLADTDKV